MPVSIKFDSVYLHFTEHKLPTSHLLTTLVGSYVGLAKVDRAKQLPVENAAGLRIIRTPLVALNLGFGIVRAVDREKSLIYVLTPLPLTQMQECNVIIRGSILTPEEVFLGQNLAGFEGPLPRVQYRYAFDE